MKEIKIKPCEVIRGTIEVPGDKSISHRAVMFGAIAKGITEADNFLTGEDCISTVNAFRSMGVDINVTGKKVRVEGVDLRGLKKPEKELYLGNSGTTMRLISGILAGQNFEVVLTGDESLSSRPMKRIIEPLKKMGVDIISVPGTGTAPLKIKGGKVEPMSFELKVASAQVKSCILLAGLYANGLTSVTEPFVSRDHTERMLRFFGVKVKSTGRQSVLENSGNLELKGSKIFVPSDISSAAFFMVAAAILKGSDLTIRNVGINPTRRGIIDVLLRMGAKIELQNVKELYEPVGDLRITGAKLHGTKIEPQEIPLLIDEIPVICVAASCAEGKTEICDVEELKVKETDRIMSMSTNLKKMGVDISSDGKNLFINGKAGRKKPGEFVSYGDHRTAMSMAIAALNTEGESVVKDVECVETSFPGFFTLLDYVSKT